MDTVEMATSLLLLVGGFFTLVGGIGLARLPDFFMRLHAPTKATTLGVGSVLFASVVYTAASDLSLRELLIALFLFITAPVSAYVMAQAGLRHKLPSRAPLPQVDRARQSPPETTGRIEP